MKKTAQTRVSVIPEDIKTNVVKFYLSDENSWQSPNRKDTVVVKNSATGEKESFPRKYLTMTISELYALYCNVNSNKDIGKSLFYELRPSYVFPTSEMPHNVCTCIYHENFKHLITCLQNQIPNFPVDEKQLLEKVCCNTNKESCMLNQCSKCSSIKLQQK